MKKMKKHLQFKFKPSQSRFLNDDDLIDVCQKQFQKQQGQINDLQGNLRIFIRDLMRLTDSIDNMYSSFKIIYEPQWVGNLEFNHMCQESVKIWRQFIADFRCNIIKTVEEYGQEFSEIRRSIEKRNKKLVELHRDKTTYDNYRNSKRIDSTKLQKLESEKQSTEQEYLNINNSLKETLPKFCDKRIQIYTHFWTQFMEAEGAMFEFLQESRRNQLKVLSKLTARAGSEEYSINSQLMTLGKNGQNLLSTKDYTQSVMGLSSRTTSLSGISALDEYDTHGHVNGLPASPLNDQESEINRTKSYQVYTPTTDDMAYGHFFSVPLASAQLQNPITTPTVSSQMPIFSKNTLPNQVDPKRRTPPAINTSDISDFEDAYDHLDESSPYAVIQKKVKKSGTKVETDNGPQTTESIKNSHEYATIEDKEYYYQMIVTHNYSATNHDELELRRNDVILVLPWVSDEQIDIGWLYGENVLTKVKGLFPENHAKAYN